MSIIKNKKVKEIVEIVMIILGTFLMGFAFNVFLNANKISPSGFSGLSAIISNVLKEQAGISIPTSVFYLAFNIIIFGVAFKKLGLKFAIHSAIGILSYSAFLQFSNFNISVGAGDLLLCAIYGGVLMGIGLGLVFRGHGSTGGSDMLANVLNKRYPFITVGKLVLIVDAIVLILSFIAYGDLTLSLYSLIAIWIMSKISDVMVAGVQSVRAYYIISDFNELIAKQITLNMQRGITCFHAEKYYSKKETNVLMIIVTRDQTVKLKQIVRDVDPNAFMFSCQTSEAMGNGFFPLNKYKNNKQKTIIKNINNSDENLNKNQLIINQEEINKNN